VKKITMLLLAGLMLTSLIAFAQDAAGQTDTQTGSNTVAAIVNGEEISMDTLNSAAGLSQIFQIVFQQLPQAFGQTLFTTPEGSAFLDRYQRDVLDQIVNTRLLVQQAGALGITADESQVASQVESRLQQIMQQNQMTMDQIDTALQQQGSSLDDYKARLAKSYREQAMVQSLQAKIVADVKVSDKDVKDYYDQHTSDYTDSDGNVSAFSDVESQVHDTVLKNAQNDFWNNWFQQAKDSADIQILFK
jgi:parvulin-like peptidyl-prolyl isomerase